MINGKMLAQTYFGVEFANRALIYIIPKADNTALPAAGNTDWSSRRTMAGPLR